MFSYLRPHRRTPSNPTSPNPEQVHSWESPLHLSPDHAYLSPSRAPDATASSRPKTSNAASPPSTVPPTSRVAPYGTYSPADPRYDDTLHEDELVSLDLLAQGYSRLTATSLADSQRWTQRQRPGSAGNPGVIGPAGLHSQRPQTGAGPSQGSRDRSGEQLPFVTATDLLPASVPTGRRAAGARMPTPPSSSQTNVSTFEPVQPRSGKTRLNLLNPMSLLARRRTPQVSQTRTLSPTPPNLIESKAQEDYDPRIRGTKVHDFSAPRQKRNVSYTDVQSLRETSAGNSPYQGSSSNQFNDTGLRVPDDRSPIRWSGGSYTPAFTEDFDEEQYPAAGPHVRKANDVSDLELPRPPYARDVPRPQDKTSSTTENISEPTPTDQVSTQPRNRESSSRSNTLSQVDVSPDATPRSPSQSSEVRENPDDTIPDSLRSGSTSKTRPRNVSQVSNKDFNLMYLPKHMKSTSSRFSFDMIGAASQEKLLEDRHRQKALEKKSSSPEPRDEYDNGEDEFDYDNMYDDDGLEEKIPGVNADAEDDDFDGIGGPSQDMGGFTFHSLGISVVNPPLSPYSPGMVSTPRDANGEVIGFAITKESPALTMDHTLQSTILPTSPAETDVVKPDSVRSSSGFEGLGLQGVGVGQDSDVVQPLHTTHDTATNSIQPPKALPDEDDLYFDDGIIDHPSDGEDAPEFDESVFDNEDTDEYGRPLRPLSSLPTLYSPPFVKADNLPIGGGKQDPGRDSRTSQELQDPNSAATPKSQFSIDDPTLTKEITIGSDLPLQPSQSLTHDTLSAYQSALAAAAYNAAANGRFRRDSNPTLYFDEREEQPGTVTDNGHVTSELSLQQPLSPSYEDDFDYDDALEDDPIIAEANAEALANDSDGFYGQEFGFYSAPAAGEAQYGGYFGPRGTNGLINNQNGRVVSREPNLTPITERSEYSNRNSVMSLPLSGVSHGVGSGTLNSPGLMQLAGMMNEYDEEDMSLNALLKLRRGAWGGSQASLRSSNGGAGPGNASPLSTADYDAPSPVQQSPLVQSSAFGGHSRQNSGFSIKSDLPMPLSWDAESVPDSPALTMSSPSVPKPTTPASNLNPSTATATSPTSISISTSTPAPPASLLSSLQMRPLSPTTAKRGSAIGLVSSPDLPYQSQSSPLDRDKENAPPQSMSLMRPRGRHQHSASSDSISYMKEDDPIAGERWVLERRRTAETGEVEILEREVVSGGRI